MRRRLGGGFLEDFQDHDRITIDSVHDSSCSIFVIDPKFMASRAYRWHGPGMRQPEILSSLEPSQQESCLNPRSLRERWRLDFPVEPHQRLGLVSIHALQGYVIYDITSTKPGTGNCVTAIVLRYWYLTLGR